MRYTEDQIEHINYLQLASELKGVIRSGRASPLKLQVGALLPDDIDQKYDDMCVAVLADARAMDLDDLEQLIRYLYSGLLRSDVRQIWRERTGGITPQLLALDNSTGRC